MWDWVNHVPVLGHIKAGIHAAANDQDNFERTLQQANEATSHTPVLGHVKAGIHQAAGDFGQAHETLEKANTVTDHVPILGHIKAGVHEAAGDHERARSALEKANTITDFVPFLGHVKGVVHLCAGHNDKAVQSFTLASTTTAVAALIWSLPADFVLVSQLLPMVLNHSLNSGGSFGMAKEKEELLQTILRLKEEEMILPEEVMILQARLHEASQHQQRLIQVQLEELPKIHDLLTKGCLTTEAYEQEKRTLLMLDVVHKDEIDPNEMEMTDGVTGEPAASSHKRPIRRGGMAARARAAEAAEVSSMPRTENEFDD